MNHNCGDPYCFGMCRTGQDAPPPARCQHCGAALPLGTAEAVFMYCGSCARNPKWATCSCGLGNLPAPWHASECPVLTEWLRTRE